MKQKLKKGDRVITTGKGKTKLWGDVVGKVTKRRGNKCSFNGRALHFPLKMRWKQMRLDYIHLTNDISFRVIESPSILSVIGIETRKNSNFVG